jgi:hypothetical protein
VKWILTVEPPLDQIVVPRPVIVQTSLIILVPGELDRVRARGARDGRIGQEGVSELLADLKDMAVRVAVSCSQRDSRLCAFWICPIRFSRADCHENHNGSNDKRLSSCCGDDSVVDPYIS